MLKELIEFSEDLYKKDKEMGIRLGKIIIALGAQVQGQNKIMKDMHDKIQKLEKEKKRRLH
jgi:hypothetical protein